MRRSWGAATILLLGYAAQAEAQGLIFDGDVVFTRGLSAFDGSPEGDLTGVGPVFANDFLYRAGWWYRKAGASSETPLPAPNPGGQLYDGNESTIFWSGLSAGSFDVSEQSEVHDAGLPGSGDGGYVVQYLGVTNPSFSETLAISIFHYIDIDLPPTADNDFATWVEWPGLIEISDGTNSATYWAQAPTLHQVGPLGPLIASLDDDSVTTLSNLGTPSGAIDFTAAFQWDLQVQPNSTSYVRVDFLVNVPARCRRAFYYGYNGLFCDGFESQNSSFWNNTQP